MNAAPRIRAMVVDDEPPARARISALLDDDPEIEVIAECGDGIEAARLIREAAPDMVFLDIQMPGLDGFSMLEAAGGPLPVVVFVTAHDTHAIRAFDVQAADYLLKPFDRERFRKALARAKAEVRIRGGEPARGPARSVAVSTCGRIRLVKVEEIDWIESDGNYARLHVGRGDHLLRQTMKDLEATLDPERFLRIHRTTIVNLDRVRELRSLPHGGYAVILADGTELHASRALCDALKSRIGRTP